MPSKDPYPQGIPAEERKGYFNYDPAAYTGPLFWGKVGLPDNFYWTEFTNNGTGTWKGILQERQPWEDDCRSGGRQSPIDVAVTHGICEEFHEIRDKPGIYKLTDSLVKKTIEPNKLRLTYPRRECHNVSHPWYALDPLCQMPSPPLGDFPNGWKGTGDVIHIDFKLPAEHTIEGEAFDGEMQIFHVHPANQRVVGLTTMIRAQVDGFNFYLQEAINAFQSVYDQNQADCAYFRATGQVATRNETNPLATLSASPTAASLGRATVPPRELRIEDDEFMDSINGTEADNGNWNRDLQVRFEWNPYHVMLIPTLYFFRYDGSITEPPCAEMVSWFVSDKPMLASFEQLEQLKNIQFTNVDATCHTTSVGFEGSVARPIQPTNGRTVWRCTEANFLADPR
jgi:carbonic anhydrase